MRAAPLSRGQIALWMVDLRAELPAEVEGWLDLSELERAGTFRHARDRRRFVAAHAAVRAIASLYVAQPPGEIAITRASCVRCGCAHAKPALDVPGCDIQYSLAHSEEFAVVAFASDEVGVDVEWSQRELNVAELARTALGPEDSRRLEAAPDAEQKQEFLRIWTVKEAVSKLLGLGLNLNFADVSVDDEKSGAVHVDIGRRQTFRYYTFTVADYAVAVTSAEIDTVVSCQWSWAGRLVRPRGLPMDRSTPTEAQAAKRVTSGVR